MFLFWLIASTRRILQSIGLCHETHQNVEGWPLTTPAQGPHGSTPTATSTPAESAVRSDPAKYGFDPMTIMAIIQIISLLWQLWQKHRVKRPPETLSEFEINFKEVNAFEGITFDDDDQ